MDWVDATTCCLLGAILGGPDGQQMLTCPPLQVVIIQPVDTGSKTHPYGHALVAGIERYPSKITRRMSKTRQEKRSKVKPFIKVINYNHLMPTRYTLELEGLKGVVSSDTFKEVSQREDAKKTVKKVLEERYTSGKNRWFFTPLSMFSCLGSGGTIQTSRGLHDGHLLIKEQSFDRFLSSIGLGGANLGSGAVNSIHQGIKSEGSL